MKQFPDRNRKRDARGVPLTADWQDAFDNAHVVAPRELAQLQQERRRGPRPTLGRVDSADYGAEGDAFADFASAPAPGRGVRLPTIRGASVSEEEHWDRVRPALIKQYAEHSLERQHAACRGCVLRAGLLESPQRCCDLCTLSTTMVLFITLSASFVAPVQHSTCAECAPETWPALIGGLQRRLSCTVGRADQSCLDISLVKALLIAAVRLNITWSARRCGSVPAVALARGFMPATPVLSPCVHGQARGHTPVWVCLDLVHHYEMQQYSTKNMVSVNGIAATLFKTHRLTVPQAGRFDHAGKQIRIIHLTRDQLERYLGACLRQIRPIRMHVEKEIADVMHPPDEPGHRIRNCPACSQGLDTTGLAVPDQKAPIAVVGDSEAPAGPAPLVVRVVRYLSSCIDAASMTAPFVGPCPALSHERRVVQGHTLCCVSGDPSRKVVCRRMQTPT